VSGSLFRPPKKFKNFFYKSFFMQLFSVDDTIFLKKN
jgi:hypothetical protein